MSEVEVLGVGLHKFGRYPDKTVEALCRDAIQMALDDSGVPFADVNAAYVGVQNSSPVLSRRLVQHFGWTGIPITTVSQACASSSAAVREAFIAIASGVYDVVLVVGYEKMAKGMLTGAAHEDPSKQALYALGLDAIPGRVALEMRERMERYQEPLEYYAQVAVQASECAVLNPNAHYHEKHTLEDVLNSKPIADPLTLFMCCPTSDGASAAVICSEKAARRYGASRAVRLAGWATGSPTWEDLTSGPGGEIGGDVKGGRLTKRLSDEVFAKAAIGPGDINVAQVHDPYTAAAMVEIEALGFCPEGEAGRWFMDGRTHINGEIPINTDGGLLCKGHPLGATGIGQIAEIVKQLRGEAGERQVPNGPRAGLTHNSGSGLINMFVLKV